MKSLDVFVQNYRNATRDFNMAGKVFLAVVLLFIFLAILYALVGVIVDTI